MAKSINNSCKIKTSCQLTAVSLLSEKNTKVKAEEAYYALGSDVFFKCNNWLEKLKYNMICYLEASGSYCSIHISNNKHLTIAQPLGEIINSLPSDVFIRVHRSYVININHVSKYCNNMFYIQNTIIPIGRTYKKEALSHFNIVMKGK